MEKALKLVHSDKLQTVVKGVVTILVPIVIFAIFLQLQSVDAIQVYKDMFTSTVTSSYGIGEVIIKSTPLILLAVGTCISSKAGLVNVGGEGQFAMGALSSTMAAVFLLKDAPGFIGIPLMAIAGMLGGMLWGGIAAVLKAKAGMNETITTVILNYIAYQVICFFVYGILKDKESFNWPQSAEISKQLKLPTITGKVSISIIFVLVIAIVAWYLIKYSKIGYHLRIIGGNAQAAIHAGFQVGKTQIIAMLISGSLAGLAGMMEIAGVEGRLRQTTGENYGYLGFLAAWMAWNNPLLAIITAAAIGFLSVSGNVLEITSGLPSSSIRILMSIVLLAILWRGKGDKK